jgi:hypothetical protein
MTLIEIMIPYSICCALALPFLFAVEGWNNPVQTLWHSSLLGFVLPLMLFLLYGIVDLAID